MLADYHTHTSFSDDSSFPMEEVVKRAILLGLDELCFTDHIDYGVKTVTNCDCAVCFNEFKRCRELYAGQINLKFGMEFGVQTHTIDQFQETFNHYDFDFIIMSCHQVNDKEFWNQDFQQGKTQIEYNELYYQEIYQTIQQYSDYSVLGHLDMIRRYDQQGQYPFAKTKDLIAAILHYIIAQGKGIEVNTSCYRYGLTDLTPARDILTLYRDLGGTILTIGSDSHEPEHLGYRIKPVQHELKQMGYTYFCTYDQMQPSFHRL